MTRKDWVRVKLTTYGEQLAGEHELLVVGSSYHFTFRAGVAQEVSRAFDWNVVLKNKKHEGQALFELAPEDDAVRVADVPPAE